MSDTSKYTNYTQTYTKPNLTLTWQTLTNTNTNTHLEIQIQICSWIITFDFRWQTLRRVGIHLAELFRTSVTSLDMSSVSMGSACKLGVNTKYTITNTKYTIPNTKYICPNTNFLGYISLDQHVSNRRVL